MIVQSVFCMPGEKNNTLKFLCSAEMMKLSIAGTSKKEEMTI